jgi:hypothetical protein
MKIIICMPTELLFSPDQVVTCIFPMDLSYSIDRTGSAVIKLNAAEQLP